MANASWQNTNSSQKLISSCERKIGLTRFTNDTINDGPDVLMDRAFDYQITPYVDEFIIYDSLDSAYRTADMVIVDPVNWRVFAPFTGQEIITIAYKNALTPDTSKMKIIHFRVHRINEQDDGSGMRSGFKRITVKLVEFPAFHMFTSNQFYKTYQIDAFNSPKQRISDIVFDSLNGIKDFSEWYDTDIEKTEKDTINFFVPNWNTMKTINFCKKYALSENKQFPMYVFHIGNDANKNKPIVYFKPVFSFIDNANKNRVYGNNFQDVQQKNKIKYNPTDTLTGHAFDYFDAYRTIEFSGNTEVSFDYIEDNSYVCNDYNNFIKNKYKSISPYVLHQPSYGNQWSKFYRSSWNKKEAELLIRNENYNDYASNILLGGVKCTATGFLYEGRNVGERAELIFNINDNEKKFDEMMSGVWLTWSITDSFVNGAASSTIGFLSDSFTKIIDENITLQKINTISDNQLPDKLTQG